MSVKFQETTKTKVTEAATAATDAAKKAGDKSEDLSHKIGQYLTGGQAGKGYLAVCDNVPCPCCSSVSVRSSSAISMLTNYRPT